MSDNPKPSNDLIIHTPLPYVVTARVVVHEDLPPERHELHVTAYSIFEALLQASIQLGGTGIEDARVKVERIEPDMEAYVAMRQTSTASAH